MSRGRSARRLDAARWNEAKLTANIYTDMAQLPAFAAVSALAWNGKPLQVASAEACEETSSVEAYTVVDPQNSVSDGQKQARNSQSEKLEQQGASSVTSTMARVLAEFVSRRPKLPRRQLGAGAGFEPATFRL